MSAVTVRHDRLELLAGFAVLACLAGLLVAAMVGHHQSDDGATLSMRPSARSTA